MVQGALPGHLPDDMGLTDITAGQQVLQAQRSVHWQQAQ